MKFHILKVLHDLESHAKDGRCGLSRNEDIRGFVGKLVEKQTQYHSVHVLFLKMPQIGFIHLVEDILKIKKIIITSISVILFHVLYRLTPKIR